MKQEKCVYLTWYDKSLREIICVEKKYSTTNLINVLKRENIQIVESLSISQREAKNNFMNIIEQLKVDEVLHKAYYENSIENSTQDKHQESEFFQHIDNKLDEAMAFYNESSDKPSKRKNRLN